MASLTFITGIISIKNSVKACNKFCTIRSSKLLISALSVLESESFIIGFQKDGGHLNSLIVELPNSEVLQRKWNSLKIISRPSVPIYVSLRRLKFLSTYSLTLTLLSTSKGVLTVSEALRLNTGGEVLISDYPLLRSIIN